MSDAIISLEHIKKSYGKHEVLKDINLEIPKGQIYGLVGRNGSGKTTMFKIILGLSDYQGGKVHVGEPGDTLDQGRERVGFFVGQNLFTYMTARENLEYYRRLKNIKDPKEVDRVLDLVGLSGVKTKVSGFSLGMRQRLGIANALLGNPEIILLDEPTNGLDPQGIADIRKLLKRLNEEFGITVIVSSHILGELQNTASTFAILNDGVIVKVLTQDELKISNNYVRLNVDDVAKARQLLTDAGITIYNESSDTLSLEDYYFSLIGGSK